MDEFDLSSFMPQASTSGSAAASGSGGGGASSFDFALDPALFGSPGKNGAGGLGLGGESEEEEEGSEDEDEDSEEEDSEEETDAEDEYRIGMGEQVRKKGKGGGAIDKGKGKQKEVGLEFDAFGEGDDDGENGELGRLISAIRDSNTGGVGGRTALEKEFDRSIEEELDGLDDDPLGRRKGKGTGRPRGRRAIADLEPSVEVKALLGRANTHYASGELAAAEELLTEVVRIDPTIRSPWYTLATIYEEKGDREKSVMFKIVATHLSTSKKAAGEWAELGGQSRDIGLLQQAIYCFSQAIKGDKTDVDSMWDRAVLLKMSGSVKQAATAFTALLAIHPHDPGVLRELAPLLASQSAYQKASDLYLSAFNYFRQIQPHVTSPEQISSFGIIDLESLADFLLVQKEYEKVAWVIKVGVRWLQGREREEGWDVLGDDREFDLVRKERDGWERDARFLEEAMVYELDVRLRLRLGIARLKMGKVDEAQRHFEIVLDEDVTEFPELFGAIADAYFELGMHTEALDVYQDMAENEETNGPPVWIKIAQCHHATGDLDGARECFEAVAEAEPDNLTAKLELAKVYEKMHDPARALATINEVIEARRRLREAVAEIEVPGAAGRDTRAPRKSKTGTGARTQLTKEQRESLHRSRAETEEQRQQEVASAFLKLEILAAQVEDGDDEATAEWLEVSTFLVDSFRETRQLFPSDSKKKFTGVLSRTWRRKGAGENDIEQQAGEMASRLERTMQTGEEPDLEEASFRGVSFDGWLTLIIKYAMLLTKNEEYEAGQETLAHVQDASVFKQSTTRSLALRLARIACYVQANNSTEALNVARWVWLRHQFETHPLRLVWAVLSQGSGPVDALAESALQKFVVRQMRQLDDATKGKVQGAGKDKDADEDDEEEEEGEEGSESRFKPTQRNPVYFASYGQLLMISRSWQSAIIYLLRAYEIDPDEPLVNLCLGISYLHRAMTRQSDNRHHQIAQALTFMNQYRKLRGTCQEVEYNFGRIFHHLGLQSYAVKHYEAVLKLAAVDQLSRPERMELDEDEDEEEEQDPKDFSKVAAYNLVSIYSFVGNEEIARAIAERWLSV
ncbi:transcription factor TFIIIC complex subunit Sfc4 [Pseudohyphozyma bogoriensis]|nr:transcription factor TFIIIC complex subunit Sfc4 [Pseudohyphozyma bogoriensis]